MAPHADLQPAVPRESTHAIHVQRPRAAIAAPPAGVVGARGVIARRSCQAQRRARRRWEGHACGELHGARKGEEAARARRQRLGLPRTTAEGKKGSRKGCQRVVPAGACHSDGPSPHGAMREAPTNANEDERASGEALLVRDTAEGVELVAGAPR